MDEQEQRKQAIAGLFGRAAPAYDEVIPYFRVFGRRLVEYVGVGPGDLVLDLGAGRGAATFPAAEAGARVLATDLAPEMLELLGADVAARQLTDRIQVRLMDADRPDTPEAAFDAVLAAFVLFFLPDPVAALGRLKQAAKPGGRIGATAFGDVDENWKAVNEVLRDAAPPPLKAFFAGPPPTASPAGLAGALREAGFVDVEVAVEPHDFTFADLDTWFAWASSQGQRLLIESLDAAARAELKERAGAVFATFANPDGSIPLRQPVAYAVGTRPV